MASIITLITFITLITIITPITIMIPNLITTIFAKLALIMTISVTIPTSISIATFLHSFINFYLIFINIISPFLSIPPIFPHLIVTPLFFMTKFPFFSF